MVVVPTAVTLFPTVTVFTKRLPYVPWAGCHVREAKIFEIQSGP